MEAYVAASTITYSISISPSYETSLPQSLISSFVNAQTQAQLAQ